MKRWISLALTLIIAISCTQGSFPIAQAEEGEDALSAPVEQAIEAAAELEVEGLVIGLEAPDVGEEAPAGDESIAEPAAEETAPAARYARIADKDTAVYEAPDGAAVAALSEGTVLVLEADAWTKVAFNTERGIVTGWIAPEKLYLLDDEETADFLDSLAQDDEVVLYDDDLDRPLKTLKCTFIETEADATEEPKPVEDVAETEEPTEAPTIEPDQEPTPEPATELTAEPTVEPTAEPIPEATVEPTEEPTPEPTVVPTVELTPEPTVAPTVEPTAEPTAAPTAEPTAEPTVEPTAEPTAVPTVEPTAVPTAAPTAAPTAVPTPTPTVEPNPEPTAVPTEEPTAEPVEEPTAVPEIALFSAAELGSRAQMFAAAGFAIDQTAETFPVGATCEISAVNPNGAAISDSELTYESSDTDVAKVSAEGVVTACAPGSAEIIVTYQSRMLSAAVNVPQEPTSISLTAASSSIGVKERYDQLNVAMSPQGSSALVTWSTSNSKIVAVNEDTGAIKGVKKGSATITATTRNGKKASMKVTVKSAPKKITLKPATLKLGAAGMRYTLKRSVGKGAASAGISYTTSDAKVATVDVNGVVTSGAAGSATITATTYNGKKSTCKVTVLGAPSRVALASSEIALAVGQKGDIGAVVYAANGDKTEAAMRYAIDGASPDAGCVTLDGDTGELTAVRKGTAYVTVTTHNGVSARCAVSVKASPADITLPAKAVIGVKDTGALLTATLVPPKGETGCAAEITWSSSNRKIVSIDARTGVMKARRKGKVTITARTHNGKKATCKVTVKKAPGKVSLSPSAVKLSAGGMKFRLTAALPKGTGGSVRYTSSNPAAATVDASGVITTVAKGSTVITAETYNGKTAQCAVTVTGVPATASFANVKLKVPTAASIKPSVNVKAADGSEAAANLSYTIMSGADYIRVDSETGEITGVKTGTAVVTAVTHNGIRSSNTCQITVVPAPTEVSLNKSKLSMGKGQTTALVPDIAADLGSDLSLTWTSSKPKVAEVDADGVVTAKATGTATITATTYNGMQASCKVTVKNAPNKVTLKPTSGTIYVGSSAKFTVSLPSGTAGSYTFTSSNPAVAAVTDSGEVEGISVGTATITVTTYNGLTDTAKVTVKNTGEVSVPASLEKLGLASYQNTYTSNMTSAQKIEYVIYNAQNQLGKPYIYGSGYQTANPKGFDCSGLVYWCYYKIGIKLGSSAYKQGYDSRYTKIVNISDLRRGDVVCFNTSNDSDLSDHTGIYLGNGYFIHASSGKSKMKVVVQRFTNDSISSDYYKRNFSWGRRIL